MCLGRTLPWINLWCTPLRQINKYNRFFNRGLYPLKGVDRTWHCQAGSTITCSPYGVLAVQKLSSMPRKNFAAWAHKKSGGDASRREGWPNYNPSALGPLTLTLKLKVSKHLAWEWRKSAWRGTVGYRMLAPL
jgi:hypothetical protein